MNVKEAEEFSKRWLQAWTGNRPDELIKFYAEDAFYSDPARREGVRGHRELLPYFGKLLAANPDWIWELVEATPTEKGFTGKWKATIPVGNRVITEYGVDIVEISDNRVTRNEVYFDRAALLEAFRNL